jgi:hypothetical protein
MDNLKTAAWMIIAAILLNSIMAFPSLPCQFYGEVISDQQYAQIGTNISAYDSDGNLCGSCTTEKQGEYILSCKADNPDTSKDEGAKEGDIIYFKINSQKTLAKSVWHESSFIQVDIIKGDYSPITPERLSEKKTSLENYFIMIMFILVLAFILYRLKRA